jgi:MinD superfamily P-loop ATPase
MARTLLKEKPKPPETRRVRFLAPVEIAERMETLLVAAQKAGFELDLDAVLTDAYAGIAKRLERELADAGVLVEAAEPATSGAADIESNAAPAPDGGGDANPGTAA